ncbi:Uu.00g124750.m01.CDS01 [Anthostomella pinea]|uniref:Uu.00g124750.m01.CDS01 n=1 Tax=Anthostomella pinea TaxID=933095 RepID=A0AAI8VIB6_9PEZI|nr:Uu.00g124750.m01.CDS01 [Anthostomella pinea]
MFARAVCDMPRQERSNADSLVDPITPSKTERGYDQYMNLSSFFSTGLVLDLIKANPLQDFDSASAHVDIPRKSLDLWYRLCRVPFLRGATWIGSEVDFDIVAAPINAPERCVDVIHVGDASAVSHPRPGRDPAILRVIDGSQFGATIPLPQQASLEVAFQNAVLAFRVKGSGPSPFQAQIHPAHHNFMSSKGVDKNPYFAVKEIPSDGYQGYKDEHGNKYYLVFPLARSNLEDLWEQNPMSPTSLQHIRWVFDQCLGMDDGLKKIHRRTSWFKDRNLDHTKPMGRHGDIKPQNILCFDTLKKNYYRLVISDFGLNRFHSSKSVSIVATEKVGSLSFTYRPPGFGMGSHISQAKARTEDDNSSEEKFFNIYNGKPIVKNSVKLWISKLRRLDTCAPCIQDFLDLIEGHLIDPNKQTRLKIEHFHPDLEKTVKKCSDDTTYCVRGSLSLAPDDVQDTRSIVGQLNRTTDKPIDTNSDDSARLIRKILEQTDQIRAANSGTPIQVMSKLVQQTTESPEARRQSTASTVPFNVADGDDYILARGSGEDHLGPYPTPRTPALPTLTRKEGGSMFHPSQLTMGESMSSQFTNLQTTRRTSLDLSRVLQGVPALEPVTGLADVSARLKAEHDTQSTALRRQQSKRSSQHTTQPGEDRQLPDHSDQKDEASTAGGPKASSLNLNASFALHGRRGKRALTKRCWGRFKRAVVA